MKDKITVLRLSFSSRKQAEKYLYDHGWTHWYKGAWFKLKASGIRTICGLNRPDFRIIHHSDKQ